jgi:acetyl esterase/lipase
MIARWLFKSAAALTLAGLSACSPIAVLNDTAPRSGFRETHGLAYGNDVRQRLDVYTPRDTGAVVLPELAATPKPGDAAMAGAAPNGGPDQEADVHGRPIVVFFYGGSWQNGSRNDYLFVGAALASRGFVAVLPDYRTYPETVFPGFIQDAAAAVRWARDHAREFGGDPSRLYIMGHSAGAQIAVLLATDGRYLAAQRLSKRDVRGVIGLAGPYDFLPLTDPVLEQVFPVGSRRASQPINFVSGDEPPMFLAAGKRDKTVDPGNTDRLAAKLLAAGDSVQVEHYPRVGHALLAGALSVPLRGLAPVLADVTRFIDSH